MTSREEINIVILPLNFRAASEIYLKFLQQQRAALS